jgi:hypothetical protein
MIKLRIESGTDEDGAWLVQLSTPDAPRVAPRIMSALQATVYAAKVDAAVPGMLDFTDELRRHAARCLARGLVS